MSEELRRQIEVSAISQDAQFARRFAEGFKRNPDTAVIAIFGLFPSLALMVYESQRYLAKHFPDVADQLHLQHADLIARSRHSLKFFDQPKKTVSELLDYFDREIRQPQTEEFTGNARFAWARRFETDLGLYFFRKTLVTNTHAAALALGLSSGEFRSEDRSSLLYGAGLDIGHYFGALSLPGEVQTTFVDFVSKTDLHSKDVKSWRYYVEGDRSPDQAAIAHGGLLKSFEAALGFVQTMLSLDMLEESRPTVFKIKYITVYQIVSSLRVLEEDESVSLSEKQRALCSGLQSKVDPGLFSSKGSRLLRNTLVHYELMNNIDVGSLDVTRPLYGLVESYLGLPTLQVAEQLLDAEINELLELFRR